MSQAEIEDWQQYSNFHHFFIRKLKPSLRPIADEAQTVVSPVDGVVAEIGSIEKTRLLQAKGCYYELSTLLGGDKALTEQFENGNFATLYLAPHDYHRIHMPLEGRLRQTIFIPGKLFSVNRMTTDLIPQLYTRNERLVCIFDTELGKMAVILIGAMIVGSMQTSWMRSPIKANHILNEHYPNDKADILLARGTELAHFEIGSTVIVLFEKNKVTWLPNLKPGNRVNFGQIIANFMKEMLN